MSCKCNGCELRDYAECPIVELGNRVDRLKAQVNLGMDCECKLDTALKGVEELKYVVKTHQIELEVAKGKLAKARDALEEIAGYTYVWSARCMAIEALAAIARR